MSKILLHVCCGPCATSSIETLLQSGYEPVLFYSDDNIDTKEEYEKRFENAIIVSKHYGLEIIKDSYNHELWLKWIKGHEKDKEHGERCSLCFRYNLIKTEKKAKEIGFDSFCTTLTVSRFKNSTRIFNEGRDLEGFREFDFKKKDGFNKSVQIAKKLNLYRQNYCGCEFSKHE